MDFYIDTAIGICWLMNYICLDISADIIKVNIKKRRTALYSLLLSAAGILCIFSPIINIAYIPLYGIIIRLLFKKCGIFEFIRRLFVSICTGMIFTAVFLTLIPGDKLNSISTEGGIIFTVDDTLFFCLIGIIYVLVKAMLFFMTGKKRLYKVKITIENSVCETTAMIDTGNSLRVPGTGEPVIIAEKALFGEIKSEGILIKCQTVCDEQGMIRVIPVDDLYLTEENRHYTGIYATLTDNKLNKNGAYCVLLHNSII